MKRWLPIIQWSFIFICTSFAILNSTTDHGILMAIDCICIGFIAGTMLARKILDDFLARLREQDVRLEVQAQIITALGADYKRAIESGEIKVIQIQQDEDDEYTRH